MDRLAAGEKSLAPLEYACLRKQVRELCSRNPSDSQCSGNLEFGHGAPGKEPMAWLCQPACPPCGARNPRAVGSESGIGIHLAINFGNKNENETALERRDECGTLPDALDRVEMIPGLLGARTDFLAR